MRGLKIHGASFSVVIVHSGFLQHLENAHHRVRTQCAVKKWKNEWVCVTVFAPGRGRGHTVLVLVCGGGIIALCESYEKCLEVLSYV